MFVINVMSLFLGGKGCAIYITGLRLVVFFQTWHLRRARSWTGGEKEITQKPGGFYTLRTFENLLGIIMDYTPVKLT